MNKEMVAIVIPVYKPVLTWWEKFSLQQVFRVLGRYTIYFVIPKDSDIPFTHIFPHAHIKEFPQQFFNGIAGYNSLMLSTEFYDCFYKYQYVLIHQLDALVFSDRLKEFTALGYDYIGAPWYFWYSIVINKKPVRLHVGNGGFSLRRVAKCRMLLDKYAREVSAWTVAEDAFWSFYGLLDKDFKRADVKTARDFSFEAYPGRMWQKNNYKMPFGCHGWHRYGKTFYCSISGTLGEKIRENAALMDDKDVYSLTMILNNYAKIRLLRRIRNERVISKYLSKYRDYLYAENVYLQSDIDSFILMALQKEGFFNTAKIIKDMSDWENGKCLLLTMDNHESLIDDLLNRGMVYGKMFISFWHEYISYLRSIIKVSDDVI